MLPSVDTTDPVAQALLGQRPRLIRLCARFTGNADAAEDLAQETLLEAWRQRQKIYDVRGIAAWTSAIARFVCQRWRVDQQRARTAACPSLHEVPAPFDAEVELERHELIHLLDRALAVLPPDVRTVLVQRYVADFPYAELAARLGMSEGAVKVKVHRGKRALRHVLTTQFRAEAAAYGLVGPQADDWQATRIWCAYCGQRRLSGRFRQDTGILQLRCPDCCSTPHILITNAHSAALFRGVHGFRAALGRVMAWENEYYRSALSTGQVTCSYCGTLNPVRLDLPQQREQAVHHGHTIDTSCVCCGIASWTVQSGLALSLPHGRRFWRDHSRIRMLPEQEVEHAGRPALVTSFQSVTGAARLDVLSDRATLTVLLVNELPGS